MVLENGWFRKISKLTMGCSYEKKKLHRKEPYSLYISPNIITLMESRKIRWERYVECK
jgi:hypothetical protein